MSDDQGLDKAADYARRLVDGPPKQPTFTWSEPSWTAASFYRQVADMAPADTPDRYQPLAPAILEEREGLDYRALNRLLVGLNLLVWGWLLAVLVAIVALIMLAVFS